jgi:hypothetical protein
MVVFFNQILENNVPTEWQGQNTGPSQQGNTGTLTSPSEFCPGLRFTKQIMPYYIISWSGSKIVRLSGGFFVE